MQHVLRCWERQSRWLRIQENPSAAAAPPGPDPAEGAYSAPTNPLFWCEGLAVPSLRTPSPALSPSTSPLLPHSKISSDAVGSMFQQVSHAPSPIPTHHCPIPRGGSQRPQLFVGPILTFTSFDSDQMW